MNPVKNTTTFSKYTKSLVEYYSTQTVSDFHVKLIDDFFKPLPENYAKYIFKVCIERLKFFPKVAELNEIFNDFSRVHNKGKYAVEKVYNNKKCKICNDSGLFVYYKTSSGRYLNETQFFDDYKNNRPDCKQYVGVCKCAVGSSKKSKYHKNYVDIFTDEYIPQIRHHSDEEIEKAELILKNPGLLFENINSHKK